MKYDNNKKRYSKERIEDQKRIELKEVKKK